MVRKKKQKVDKAYRVRAYCTDCGKLLLESNWMSKKELMANWDQAVLDAPGIVCQDCAPKRCPNFHIELKIYHAILDKEFMPDELLPTPEKEIDLGMEDYLSEPLKHLADGEE